jgi:hypothetical protein
METDLTYEELKDLIYSVENGDISAEDAWNSILLFQKKNKVNLEEKKNE